MERTLIIVKPDAVQRGLIGEIIRRFENRGLRIAGMKFMQVSRDVAARHYAEHEGKGFYEGLIDYITSAPVVVMALEGKDAIAIARNTIGKTKPIEAAPGTIRGDFGMEVGRNLVHGSDKPESAERELGIFFDGSELYDWTRDVDPWIFEG
ncbi:nucleoside-diphosphate kinase [Aggregatilinea lenta]|uniref:nucleoside-diphosphate kinase n=1 Tax=Aggregatilinea lenta TaxID=913108 RepID=UPI000E5C1AE7|nr:nucleoside-diphosphate kinase [Aggregatilinea lenta]